jgi:hypothetical protein
MSREQALGRQKATEEIIRARLQRNIERLTHLSEVERAALLESELRKALSAFDEIVSEGPPSDFPGIDDDGFFKDRE